MIGQNLLDVSPNRSDGKQAFAGVHPVDVAAQRVDLAVMRDVAIGMRRGPAREGVGAEARMHQGEGRFHQRIEQIGKIRLDLHGIQHALIDQGRDDMLGK